jgi:hypothetical protein
VTLAAAWQTVVAAVNLVVWMAWALWGVFPFSLLFASVLWGIPLAVSAIAAGGLWRGSTSCWWLALVFDLLGLAFCSWQCSWQRQVDVQDTTGVVLFLVPIVLLLLPDVRRFFDIPHKPTGLLSA